MFVNKRKNKGMAIVIVLCFSAILLGYGTVLLKQYTDTTPVSKIQLERIQADFFAKGIQNIILFKIKKIPDFFLKSYRQYVWGLRTDTGADDYVPLTAAQISNNPFLGHFMLDGIFGSGGSTYYNPLDLDYYTANIKLLNAVDFQNETIEISVEVKFNNKDAVNNYVAVINGDLEH